MSGGILNFTPKEVFTLCSEGVILVDVREEYLHAFRQFFVPEIIYLPFSILISTEPLLPQTKHLICADAAGLHSKEAVQYLLVKGFTNVANLAGGMVEWERVGLPVIKDSKNQLSGQCMCQLKKRKN